MSDRLTLALERSVVALPDGDVLVLGATADSDLSAFGRERTHVHTRSATVAAQLEAQGWSTKMCDGYAGVAMFLPRARAAQRAYVKQARALCAGPIIIDGSKTDGVDALYRDLKGRAEVTEAWSKAHGKVFTITSGDFADWPDLDIEQAKDGWRRGPGVFSADGIDKASELLAQALPATLKGSVVDLGAGWGYLGDAILKRDGVSALHMVEDDSLAAKAAAANISDPRAHVHWADARSWRPDALVDHVVTNPPFHTGRAAEPALGQAFIRAAADMLKPKGSLWLVANRQLPYEGTLEDAFRNVQTLTQNPSFKLFHATSPNPRRKG